MKEIRNIVNAYGNAVRSGLGMALATVVKVEGSSYRQPGARMLVTEDGRLTGAISGGCLEGDALRKALLVIHRREKKLITYDTHQDDHAEFGVQLGCNGIVHILFEYIDINDAGNPVKFLEKLQEEREEAVLITVFSTLFRSNQPGTLSLAGDHVTASGKSPEPDLSLFSAEIRSAKENKQSFLKAIEIEGKPYEALIEYVAPAVHLVIAGAGNDAKPLVEAAGILGWDITVIDGRATHALPQRFPKANRVIVVTPGEVTGHIDIDPLTVFVLMTHNYRYDLVLLEILLATPTPYIGVLGPKTKLERMFNDLAEKGVPAHTGQKERIYGPVGLNIGAETSEEIAISIVSEIKAVLSGKTGGPLTYLTAKIHGDIPLIS